jgi:hypothetical protein
MPWIPACAGMTVSGVGPKLFANSAAMRRVLG